MKIDSKHKIRSVADENIIIMQGKGAADMTKVVSLNSTSVWLFEQLRGREFTTEDVAGLLVEKYGIDNDLARHDAQAWADKLVSCGVITE